jgi:hypothetical protein
MKKNVKLLLLSLFTILIFSGADCHKKPVGPEIPLYSYLNRIVNPPDTFQIAYNLSTYGDKTAHVVFKENAVWLVEKQGAGKVIFKAIDDNSGVIIVIDDKDTLAMQGGIPYSFIANNNNFTDITNYFVQFTKLPLSYDNFQPKFK